MGALRTLLIITCYRHLSNQAQGRVRLYGLKKPSFAKTICNRTELYKSARYLALALSFLPFMPSQARPPTATKSSSIHPFSPSSCRSKGCDLPAARSWQAHTQASLLYQIRLKTCIFFAQKNEKPRKGLSEISRCRAKSHSTKRATFRSAEGQREPNQPDLEL